jgi:hypothetical protein
MRSKTCKRALCSLSASDRRYPTLDRSAVCRTQADRPGYPPSQYWLDRYANDWNEKAESHWEFIRVLFRASTI